MKETRLIFSLPLSEGREWCRFTKGEWEVCKRPSKNTPSAYAFSAKECQSFPLWVNSCDDSIIAQLVKLEVERITGIGEVDLAQETLVRKISRHQQHTLVHVTVFGQQLNEDVGYNWQRFTASPLLAKAEGNTILIWREENYWIAGFFHEGLLIHWHPLGTDEALSNQHITELQWICEDLTTRRMCGFIKTIRFSPEITDEKMSHLKASGFTIEQGGGGSHFAQFPKLDATNQPSVHVEFRNRQKKRHKLFMMAAMVSMLLVALVVLAIIDIKSLQQQLAEDQSKVDRLGPKADQVRVARDRWEALSPAFDYHQYPVEIFHRVAVLLPQQGIRLLEFEVTNGRITVRGEAKNVPTAIRFKAALENSEDLASYRWEVPPPSIVGDTAKFVAYGVNPKLVISE